MSTSTTQNQTNVETLLLQHFATLATGPGGIARLRELILQLAVQGKLGTQDENDEPASVLLERIRREKEQLVKEGEIKASKLNPLFSPPSPNSIASSKRLIGSWNSAINLKHS
ncbi:hypothetical protein [Methanocalculus sp.]|uniref:hypothetical protein n=1 Tax=Methanocalculus sp. TaxID=2004547 RepID=UPI0027226569|nr:hypothetical protein [Methanocalculus sp.]MDO8842434.1 hypothetical protein [Methanocalculus sp.]